MFHLMARPLHLEFPGALYHITARGNAQQPIFLKDGDRHQFIWFTRSRDAATALALLRVLFDGKS